MQTRSDTLTAPKVALTFLLSIVLNELLFLYLIPGDLQSSLTLGAISGLAGAVLHLMLSPGRLVTRRSTSQPPRQQVATHWHPQLAGPWGHRK